MQGSRGRGGVYGTKLKEQWTTMSPTRLLQQRRAWLKGLGSGIRDQCADSKAGKIRSHSGHPQLGEVLGASARFTSPCSRLTPDRQVARALLAARHLTRRLASLTLGECCSAGAPLPVLPPPPPMTAAKRFCIASCASIARSDWRSDQAFGSFGRRVNDPDGVWELHRERHRPTKRRGQLENGF